MIPLPVLVSQEHQNVILYGQWPDFGITAAIVAAIALTGTAAKVAGVTISQTAVTAETVLSGEVGGDRALRTRSALDSQIGFGLLNLDQWTAILPEQVDFLWLLRQVSCSHSCSAACILPADVVGASDVAEQLNAC